MEQPNLPELLLALKQPEESTCQPAMQALIAAGEKSVPLLLVALDTEDEKSVQIRIKLTLNKIARELTLESTVQMLLHANDPKVREWTAHNVRYGQGELANKLLITALADSDLTVREAVIYALGYLGNTHAVEPLISILNGNEQKLRIVAARVLGKLRDLRALASLLATLNDSDPKLRIAVCTGLDGLRSPEATRPLLNLLKTEPDSDVRAAAIQSLEVLYDWSVQSEDVSYVSYENRADRLQAAILVHLDEGDKINPLKNPLVEILKSNEDSLVRAYAAGLFLEFKEGWPSVDVIEPLKLALKDSDDNVRMNVVSNLTKLEAIGALEAIIPMLDDSSSAVRWEACRYLEKFGDERVLSVLENLGRKDNDAFRKTHTVKEAAQAAIAAIRQRTDNS